MKIIENKTIKMLQIEHELGVNIEDILRSAYVDMELSAIDLGDNLGVSHVTIIDWLKQAGVYSRNLKIE